jgi:hypothetical protein
MRQSNCETLQAEKREQMDALATAVTTNGANAWLKPTSQWNTDPHCYEAEVPARAARAGRSFPEFTLPLLLTTKTPWADFVSKFCAIALSHVRG